MTMAVPAAPNPALADLAVLIGDWTMELSHAAFLPDPGAMVVGKASWQWIEDGALLALSQGGPPPGTPAARWIVGRDEASPLYTVLYVDSRGVSRVYRMRFESGIWELWREATGFSQRFSAHLSDDMRTVTGTWETSLDGTTWEHDFDVVYRRVERAGG